MSREELLRAGRNSLFQSLFVSGIISFIVSLVLSSFNNGDASLVAVLALMINAVICYPLYRYLVLKKVGGDETT